MPVIRLLLALVVATTAIACSIDSLPEKTDVAIRIDGGSGNGEGGIDFGARTTVDVASSVDGTQTADAEAEANTAVDLAQEVSVDAVADIPTAGLGAWDESADIPVTGFDSRPDTGVDQSIGTGGTGGAVGTGGAIGTGGATGVDAPTSAGGMGGGVGGGVGGGTGGMGAGGTGGAATTGGLTSTGGATISGGVVGTGGVIGTGGTTSTGGVSLTGGSLTTGGVPDTGGVSASGGVGGSGGTSSMGPGWTQVGPGLRSYAMGSGYDALNDRMILFGGDGETGKTTGVMVLANASGASGTPTWIQLTASGTPPQGRVFDAVLYDGTRNRLIVHGGCAGNCAPALADTWALSNANGLGGATPQWSRILPDAPVVRAGPAAGYDEANKRLIVFGGGRAFAGTDMNDVWVMTEDTGGAAVWSQLSPQGTPPAARSLMAYYYDASSNSLVIFGGYTYVSPPSTYVYYNDVWVLSHANGLGGGSTWTQVTPSGGHPSSHALSTIVFDQLSDRALLFGGYWSDGSSSYTFGDLWILNHPTGANGSPQWLSVSPTGSSPASRCGHVAAYAPNEDRLIITSGYTEPANTWPTDTWVFQGARQLN
jgi:hypothetical protein